MKTKNILLQVKHKNEIYNLFTRTNSANVIVDSKTGETLKERLATIAALMGTEGVAQQIEQKIQEAINELVNGEGDPKVLDTIKDLVGWINDHQEEFQDLVQVTSALENAVNEKLATQKEELEGKISSVKEEIESTIADTKSALEEAIAGIAEDVVENSNAIAENKQAIEENKQAISDLNDKVDELIPEDGEGALVRRNGVNQWEQIFNIVEELPEVMNEGQLFCVLLDDDPVATIVKADGSIMQYATVEDALTQAESGETVRLTDDVVLSEDVQVADGVTIIADGKVIVC